jgi:DNA-binding transcriptional LysR family regulator
MNLRWLQAYRAVMATGTITEAAGQLHVTQPAVSRMIANLEGETGFRLFHRERGRLVPTTEGESFFRETERVLDGIVDILEVARDIRTSSGGRLRIVAMASFVFGLLPEAITRFKREAPRVRLILETRERRDVERWVASQQFDLGIANLPIDNAAVVTREFFSSSAVLVMSKEHRLASCKRVRISDLADEPMVMLRGRSLARGFLDKAFREHKISPSIAIETSTMASACQLAARGLGIALADRFSLSAMAQSDFITRPLDPPLTFHYGFLFPANRPVSQMVQRFADIIAETAGDLLGARAQNARRSEP